MPQAVTIGSLAREFELVKGMQGHGLEWGEGYRPLGRQAIADVLRGQMDQAIDEHLERMANAVRTPARQRSARSGGCAVPPVRYRPARSTDGEGKSRCVLGLST